MDKIPEQNINFFIEKQEHFVGILRLMDELTGIIS